MVTSVTSFSRTGLSDWLIQRVTSLVLLTYFIVIAYQLLGSVDYTSWRWLFDQTWMKVFTVMAALSLAAHSWIGLWSVFTDHKPIQLCAANDSAAIRVNTFIHV